MGRKPHYPPPHIIGTEGNDNISTKVAKSIDGRGGDDTINANINASRVYKATVWGGTGNDRINVNDYKTTPIDGGPGDDWIDIRGGTGKNAFGGDGNDTIYCRTEWSKIYAGPGDDYIENSNFKPSLYGGDGNDTIVSGFKQTTITIEGGGGDDLIRFAAANSFIQYNPGDGNDTIEGFDSNSLLKIGDGKANYFTLNDNNSDAVVFVGDNMIILKGAASLSSINIQGTKIEVIPTLKGTDGDDLINNGFSNVVRDTGDGNDTVNNSNENVSIISGNGNDSIRNSGSNVTIDAGDDNDTVYNEGSNVTIDTGNGNDTISNSHGSNVTISSGAGNDSIENENSYNVTISGGAGDDTLRNNLSKDISMNGDAGNDYIYNDYAENVTISGGAGNDSIRNRGNNVLYQYNTGEGNDTIQGFNSTSTLKIGDGTSTYSTLRNDFDVIVFVDNNWITLKDAAKLSSINIQGTKIEGRPTLKGTDGNDSIYNEFSNVVRDAGDGNDTIDNRGANVSLIGGKGNDSISLASGTKNNLIQYNPGEGNDTIYGFNSTSTLQIGDGTGTYSTVINNSDVVVFVDNNWVLLKDAAKLSSINIQGTKIEGRPTLNGTDGNDSIYNEFSNIIITGGKGNDSISLASDAKNNFIQYTHGDGNDTIYGFNSTSTLKIGDGTDTYATVTNGSDMAVFVGTNWIVLKDAASLSPNIQGTKIDGTPTLKGTDGNDSIHNEISNVIIADGTGNNTIKNNGSNVTISSGAGNDSIYNETGSNVTISSGAGSDSIYNKTGSNVTMSGGEGNDSIYNFDASNVTISGGAGNDSIENFVSSTVAISGEEGNDYINNSSGKVTIYGGTGDDTVRSYGSNSTVSGGAGNDSINNVGENVIITGDAGKDTLRNDSSKVTIDGGTGDDSFFNWGEENVSIGGGDGHDYIFNSYKSSSVTINAGAGNDNIDDDGDYTTINGGKGNDTIRLRYRSGNESRHNLIQYKAGDGNDTIYGFNGNSTLAIAGSSYSTEMSGRDVIVNVGDQRVVLADAINLDRWLYRDPINIVNGTYANFTINNSAADYQSDLPDSFIRNAYNFNRQNSSLTINDNLKNYAVTVKNEDSNAKMNWSYGSANLNKGSAIKYYIADEKNNVSLTSNTYGDKITFGEDSVFNYGEMGVDLLAGGVISTNGAKEITFDNYSSAKITAPEGAKFNISASKLTVNDMTVNSFSGAGTISVNSDGLSFKGYGVQFGDLEVAMDSYFRELTPIGATYNSADKSYAITKSAQVKTLSDNFTKLTLESSGDNGEKYAHYKINGKEFLVANGADNLNVVEANGNTFKIQDKEVNGEKVGRVTIDEQITFSGTQIDFDGVKINYAHNKPAIYSLDGKEITISDAATITTGDETKTFKCEAGSYVINGKSFETSADLTFTADTKEIKIPLNDLRTEIDFNGVKVNGVATGAELVFDFANDKILIPDSATVEITSPEEVKLNLAAGNFTFNYRGISTDNALEITADKESVKVPLSENGITINGAKITGSGIATIENADEYSIVLPNGALVENGSENIYEINGKDGFAYFGDKNKKVQLTEDGTAYISYEKENEIFVGINALLFEEVEIQGNDSWTVETSGTSGIDKITGIKNGATISTSTEYIETGDLRIEVETEGAGEFTICGQKFTSTDDDKNVYVVKGNSNSEIKVSTLADEYADDDSESAGTTYQYDTAGDHTVNGITFHATENSKVQTITRGVEFDLSSGTFQYDGLTLEGSGTAQINRYNAQLVSLSGDAKISGKDETKYNNRQFEINGTVELIGKKFETNQPVRCALINIADTIDDTPVTLAGFVVDDKYVQIQSDCYDSVKIVDKKISSIEGVKNSAEIYGNGATNVSIGTVQSGEFTIGENTYTISDDSDGVTFITNSHGNVSEINGLTGSVEGDFASAINVNGKTIRITGASSIKVTSDGTNITEISNVAGDLVTLDEKTYRKNVRVYESGGTEKLTTSENGTIIFSGNKFEMSAGKTFTLDSAGNISEINDSTKTLKSYDIAAENLATIDLSTTEGLEEVFGDFSEGITVNGVFVKVTESTNFVVKNDDENVYIETTAPDTFNINGKSFETFADKTIFKLDESGDVSEIVTDTFYLSTDEDVYVVEGDFTDEIIFNGKKFCVTGTDDTSVFVGEENLIYVELEKNSVEVVESGGAAEIALSGEGELIVGGKTFSTSEDFVGLLYVSSEGLVEKIDYFIGTLSGELGGIEIAGVIIDSEDTFSLTSDGEKITAIENLKNGSFTSDNLNDLTINGEKLSVDDSEEITITVVDGKLKNSEETVDPGTDVKKPEETVDSGTVVEEPEETIDSGTVVEEPEETIDSGTVVEEPTETIDSGTFTEELLNLENASVVSGEENITLSGDDVIIIKDTAAEVDITASKGLDTIVSQGKNVHVSLTGGNTWLFPLEGRITLENYDATTKAGFGTNYTNILSAVGDGSINFENGVLNMNDARVEFGKSSELMNFFNRNGRLQKVGFASQNDILDVSDKTDDLLLVAKRNGSIISGMGDDTILANGGNSIDGGAGANLISVLGGANNTIVFNGRTTVEGFRNGFGTGDTIYIAGDPAGVDFKSDGLTFSNDNARLTLSDVTTTAKVNLYHERRKVLNRGVFIAENDWYEVTDSDLNIGAGEELYFVGTSGKVGVDFSGITTDLNVTLDTEYEIPDNKIWINGVYSIKGGAGNTTITGSDRNDTILAGTGEQNITGGLGNDKLIGNTSADKNVATFNYAYGDGRDSIESFDFMTDSLDVTADKVKFDDASAITDVFLRGDDVGIRLNGEKEFLMLEGAQGKSFHLNDDLIAKVDKNVEFDGFSNCYVGIGARATLTVDKGMGDVEVWLSDDSLEYHGTMYDGNFAVLDASKSDGNNILAGNEQNNSIVGGTGNNSLWGGYSSSDDTLIGGAGQNSFFYLQGNGKDVIRNVHDGDKIFLDDITLDQIVDANISSAGVAFNFTDGGSLNVNGTADVTYQLADGSKYSANHLTLEWHDK